MIQSNALVQLHSQSCDHWCKDQMHAQQTIAVILWQVAQHLRQTVLCLNYRDIRPRCASQHRQQWRMKVKWNAILTVPLVAQQYRSQVLYHRSIYHD